jgi:hypothetical protein
METPLLDMAKDMLAKGMPRENIINAIESFDDPEAPEALEYAKTHMLCRKCDEVKEVVDFPKETSHHCNDCRPESKERIFCLFSKEDYLKIKKLADAEGITKHEWVHRIVLDNLPKE